MQLRKIVVIAVLVVGVAASIASSSTPEDSGGGGGNGGGGNGGGGGGGASTQTTASGTRGEADQIDDVTLGECTTDPTLGFLTASLTVTNNSSDASDYLIDVTFQSEDGATQFGTGNAFVQGLQTGQTTTVEATSLDDAPDQPFVCTLASVTRTAAL